MCERSRIQHWLRSVKTGHIVTFEELTDWNLVAPKKRLSHCGHPVRGIVPRVVFEFLHARTEPLVRIVVVVGNARAEDIQEREALVLDALLDQIRQVFLFGTEAAGDECGSGSESQ